MLKVTDKLRSRLKLLKEYLIDPSTINNIIEAFNLKEGYIDNGTNLHTVEFMLSLIKEKGLDVALVDWPKYKKNMKYLVKRMLVIWRRLQILTSDLGLALFADQSLITNLPSDHPEWQELGLITQFFRGGDKEQVKAYLDKSSDFVYMGQISHAKSRGAIFNPLTFTDEQIEAYFGVDFFHFEDSVRKLEPNRPIIEFKKGYQPPLPLGFWKQMFNYMMNKEKAFVDLEFFLCFANPYIQKDFWNTCDSSFGKFSSRVAFVKIPTNKKYFLPVDTMYRQACIQKEFHFPRFLDEEGKKNKVEFTAEELIPHHLYFDTDEDDRVCVRILCGMGLNLKKYVQSYASHHGIILDKVKQHKLKVEEITKEIEKEESLQKEAKALNKKYSKSEKNIKVKNDSLDGIDKPKPKKRKSKGGIGSYLKSFFVSSSTKDKKNPSNDQNENDDSMTEGSMNEGRNSSEVYDKKVEDFQGFMKGELEGQDDDLEGRLNKRTMTNLQEMVLPSKEYIEEYGKLEKKASFNQETYQVSSNNLEDPDDLEVQEEEEKQDNQKGGEGEEVEKKVFFISTSTPKNAEKINDTDGDTKPEDEGEGILTDQEIIGGGTQMEEGNTNSEFPKFEEEKNSEKLKEETFISDNLDQSHNKDTSAEEPKKEKFIPNTSQKVKDYFKNVVFHIHGGGYIAMNSSYYQIQTRPLTLELEMPIFSIDYRLAPNARYPENIEDCILCYFWMINYVENIIGTQIETITVMGDSAGGGLSFSLVTWLIENRQRVPDLLLLSYPALRIEKTDFVKSSFIGLEDFLLHYSAMKTVTTFYTPEGFERVDGENYYFNQVEIRDEVLSKFPKTRFFTTMHDPLRDDQINIVRRMQKIGVDILLNCFAHLQHGALTISSKKFDLPRLLRESLNREIKLHMIQIKKEKLQREKEHNELNEKLGNTKRGQEVVVEVEGQKNEVIGDIVDKQNAEQETKEDK